MAKVRDLINLTFSHKFALMIRSRNIWTSMGINARCLRDIHRADRLRARWGGSGGLRGTRVCCCLALETRATPHDACDRPVRGHSLPQNHWISTRLKPRGRAHRTHCFCCSKQSPRVSDNLLASLITAPLRSSSCSFLSDYRSIAIDGLRG